MKSSGFAVVFGLGAGFASMAGAQRIPVETNRQDADAIIAELNEYAADLASSSSWPIAYDPHGTILVQGGGFTLSFHFVDEDELGSRNGRMSWIRLDRMTIEGKIARWQAEVCTPDLQRIIDKYHHSNIGMVIKPDANAGVGVAAYAWNCPFGEVPGSR